MEDKITKTDNKMEENKPETKPEENKEVVKPSSSEKPEVAKQEIKEAPEEKKKPETTDIEQDEDEEKSEEDKPEKKIEIKKVKKTEALVNARNLPISTKHSIAICNMIRNKDIDEAISLLERAEKKQIPVPMRGEIPHRKGIMSGRYPINALGHFIKALKSLKSNALANELELEKYKIFCKSDVASRPYRRFGKGKFKRTNLTLKLIIPIKKKKKSKKQGSKK